MLSCQYGPLSPREQPVESVCNVTLAEPEFKLEVVKAKTVS